MNIKTSNGTFSFVIKNVYEREKKLNFQIAELPDVKYIIYVYIYIYIVVYSTVKSFLHGRYVAKKFVEIKIVQKIHDSYGNFGICSTTLKIVLNKKNQILKNRAKKVSTKNKKFENGST